MHPFEITRLNDIAANLNLYERASSGDQRGGWSFTAIAGPGEIWAGEFLVQMWLGHGICFGFEEISDRVTADIAFITGLMQRFPVILNQ
jgi:hypothetical protein